MCRGALISNVSPVNNILPKSPNCHGDKSAKFRKTYPCKKEGNKKDRGITKDRSNGKGDRGRKENFDRRKTESGENRQHQRVCAAQKGGDS